MTKFTERREIHIGDYILDVMITEDTDIDDRFKALCNDTGGWLMINGWMIDACELRSLDA